jgi:uncharacterized protein (DUF58 family)
VTVRPGPRLLLALAVVTGVALLAPLWTPLRLVCGGALLGLLAWTLLEGLLLRRVEVRSERAETSVVSLGEVETLLLTLSHDAPYTLRLEARQVWPLLLDGGAGRLSGRCPPGERLALSFSVRGVARGSSSLEPPTVSLFRWGLAERITTVGARAEVNVLPNLRAVRRLHRQLNDFFLRGAGTRVAPRIGQGRDFDRLREYVTGDDFRHLAWKASARARKLIVREFRIERSQDVVLCVDRGHRMAGRVGPLSRNDHAVNAAVLTAYLCNRVEDRVGMLSFATEVDKGVAQGRGAAHLAALTRFGVGIAPEYLHTDYRVLAAHLRRRLKTRSLVLLFTAVPERGDHEPLLAALRTLMPSHLPAVVVLRDPGLEAAADAVPKNRGELSSTLVAGDLVGARRQLMQAMRALGVIVAEANPEDTGVVAVNTYLDVKRRQLL